MKPIPKNKIIRLNGKAKKKLQASVLLRDGATCRRCGVHTFAPPHHIIFLSHGGSDVFDNLIMICTECHDAIHHKGWLKCYGDSDNLVFSLTVEGKLAVENGKLRKEA